jgi:hypothetical protein
MRTSSPNIWPNIRCRFSCISPMSTAPNGEFAVCWRRATESRSFTSVTSAWAFMSSTVPSVSPVSGSQTSSPSGEKTSKTIPVRTPSLRPLFSTISLLPRTFATLPSTVIRLPSAGGSPPTLLFTFGSAKDYISHNAAVRAR